MRILVVSQFFPPEIGAAQNRLDVFTEGLRARGHDVTVICEQPNHPQGRYHPGFGRRPLYTERRDRMTVHRTWVVTGEKTKARRAAFYATFMAGALAGGALIRRPDVVFTSSPPLPGALAAGVAAAARRLPFVLDVRDLWPAVAVALDELTDPTTIRALEASERWLYRRAHRVTTTTERFCEHIDRIAGAPRSLHVPNGAMDDLVERRDPEPGRGSPFVVGYVGNIGVAQGVEVVLRAAERLRGRDVAFRVVGDGPMKAALQESIASLGLRAVELRPAVPLAEVGDVLASCDALLVPLRGGSTLEHFIPSKLYDAMAVGRPVILAAGGEAAELVRRTGCGIVIPAEDGEALADAVGRLDADRELCRRMGAAGKRASAAHARSRQVVRVEEVLLEAAGDGAGRAG